MNDDKKSKIEVDASSLLSLKTELLRKKAEAVSNQPSVETRVRNVHKTKISIESGKREKDSKVFEVDDSNDKVKRTLEAKAKYYDRMQNSGQNTTLILFKNKPPVRNPVGSEDYVEFTDEFGRTRSVSRDEFNARKRQQAEDAGDEDYTPIEETKPEPEEVGESFTKQREEWKNQERVNSEQNEIFYQDLLFNEAREHGTAFYSFSADHAEREEQQYRFKKMRENTEEAQSQRDILKRQRDNIIKNRVSHAKARLRQKLGLPPEPEQPETTEDQNKDTAQEAPEAVPDEKEIERERQRKEHIRPWDRDKLAGKRGHSSDDDDSGDEEEWMPKREKFLMTQEEYVDKQRLQRDQSFAPTYDSAASSSRPFRSSGSSNVENDVMANLKFIRKKFD
jgi:hypothetical protein